MFKSTVKILGFASMIALFAACNKTISNDNPKPPVYKPTVIMPTGNGIIYGLDALTGNKIYEYRGTDSTSIGAASDLLTHNVAVDNANNAYVGVVQTKGSSIGAKYVECYNAGDGKYKWRVRIPNVPSAAMTIVNDLIMVPAGDSLFGIGITSANQGNIIFRWGSGSTANRVNGSVLNAPDGYIYWHTSGSGPGGAKVYCINLKDTANTRKSFQMTTGNFDGRTSIGFGNNRIYVTYDNVSNGAVVCLNGKLENFGTSSSPLIWTYNIPSKSTYSSPLVYGDMCVIGSHDYKIHCIDGTSGVSTIRWTYPTGERINSSATVDKINENVIIGSNDFNLYAINFVTGKLRWKFPTASIILSSPTLWEGKLYFNSLDKYMYCVEASTGTLIWKKQLNIIAAPSSTAAVSVASAVVCDMNGKTAYPAVSGNSEH